MENLLKKSIKSAADFNAHLMRELRQERRSYFDLQTYVSQSSHNLTNVANLTLISLFVFFLIPLWRFVANHESEPEHYSDQRICTHFQDM